MPEPQETVEPQTAAPEIEATQSGPTDTQETAALTREDVKALIEEVSSEREATIRKEIEQTYKTLRRGEAKSDISLKRMDTLERKLEDLATRGMTQDEARIWKLEREVERSAEARNVTQDPNAEVSVFQSWASSYLEEEGLNAKDPVLVASFERHAGGWQNSADLKVAMTKAVAEVRKEEAKKAKSESADREKKAREDERAKLRNEKRQEEGKVDKGVAASSSASSRPQNFLAMSQEEWDAFKSARRR